MVYAGLHGIGIGPVAAHRAEAGSNPRSSGVTGANYTKRYCYTPAARQYSTGSREGAEADEGGHQVEPLADIQDARRCHTRPLERT